MPKQPVVATYSIVGRDPRTGELGVAVQSKFFSVGSVVPWVAADAGAIATQSAANTAFGPDGLALLRQGLPAQEVLDRLISADPTGGIHRQVGIVDTRGGSATHTGPECNGWAGGLCGPNYAAQGNILVGAATVEAMVQTFLTTQGDLAHRLTEALDAGERAGGDSRGRQSAALYVAKTAGGYGGMNDRYIDIRVDDHPEPTLELKRLLGVWRLYFEKPPEESLIQLEGAVLAEVTAHLTRQGYLREGVAFATAWRRFVGTENFEERDIKPGYIDPLILQWIRSKS